MVKEKDKESQRLAAMFRDAEARLHMAQETIRMMREQSCVQVAVKKEVREWGCGAKVCKSWATLGAELSNACYILTFLADHSHTRAARGRLRPCQQEGGDEHGYMVRLS